MHMSNYEQTDISYLIAALSMAMKSMDHLRMALESKGLWLVGYVRVYFYGVLLICTMISIYAYIYVGNRFQHTSNANL